MNWGVFTWVLGTGAAIIGGIAAVDALFDWVADRWGSKAALATMFVALSLGIATGAGLMASDPEPVVVAHQSSYSGHNEAIRLQRHGCHHVRLSQDHATCLDFNWAIQGELSHQNCDTQPGAKPWYNVVDGHKFFMGCRQDAIKAPATSDPDAPPPPADVLEMIKLFIPHSTTEWKRFKTLHEAAIYAAVRLELCSVYYECSGFITQDPKDGRFAVSPVRTDYASDHVRIEDDSNPSDWKIVADIHSHPCVPHHWTNLFSPEDMIGSITGRTTSYMVDLCSGEVHEFIPGVTRPDETQAGEREWFTGGKIIGKIAAFRDEPVANEGL